MAIIGHLGCASAPEKPEDRVQAASTPVQWAEARGLPTSGLYRGLAVADLNNDGHPDVIGGAAQSGTISIWEGKGPRGLARVINIPVKGAVQSVTAGDVNGDGFTDIVFTIQKEGSGVAVLQNRAGKEWVTMSGPTEIGVFQGVTTADVNADGYLDIIAASRTSELQGGVQVWLGDGRGGWPVETGPDSAGEYNDVAVADFNGDGHLDIAAAGWGRNNALRLWFGDGAGGWGVGRIVAEGSWYALTAEDIDGDGYTDILAGSYRAGVAVFKGSPDGTFSRIDLGASESFWKAVPIDMDGDGVPELAASSLDGNGIRIWKKSPDSAGYVQLQADYAPAGVFYDLVAADVNEDGAKDLVAASFGEGVKVWLGRAEGFSSQAGSIDSRRGPQVLSPGESIEENEVFTTRFGFPEYRLDSGDVLQITFWRGTEGSKEMVTIRPDGKISFGYVEDLYVRGMTPTELDRVLTRRLEAYIRHPRIDVLVDEYNSKSVTILGAVGYRAGTGPGQYKLKGKARLSEMLSEAGGPRPDANLRDIRIRRKNNQSITVNLYRAITQGDVSQDIVLDNGDVIYVQALSKESNRVYVFGEVEKPGAYTFEGSEMRVFDAVAQAGGYTVFGKPALTKVVRGDITRPKVIDADLKALVEKGDYTQNVALANGDLVYVPRSAFGDLNQLFKRISPLMRLIIYPAQVVNEYGRAADYYGTPFDND
ncbi:MAG: FG-GAP-like repeat-containing protein [Desulfobacterales bacterium]